MRLIGFYPCPFCGSTSMNIRKKSTRTSYNGLDWRVDTVTASVRCGKCHARGGVASGKVIRHTMPEGTDLPEWATTIEDIEQRALVNWNRRER